MSPSVMAAVSSGRHMMDDASPTNAAVVRKRATDPALEDTFNCSDGLDDALAAMESELPPVRASRSRSLTDRKSSLFAVSTRASGSSVGVPPPPMGMGGIASAPPTMMGDARVNMTADASGTTTMTGQAGDVEPTGMRRTMSAEFTLSMLQQELGYPRRKSSLHTSRPPSSNEKRRAGSWFVEDSPRNSGAWNANGNGNGTESAPHSRSTTLTEPDNEDDCDGHAADDAAQVDDDDDATDDGREAYEITASEDDNFLDYRLAIVTGYTRGTDGVVYYEIIVKSTAHGPLSAYKVRRRYSEFRALHRALAKIMPTSNRISFSGMLTASAFQNDDVSECSLRFSQSRSRGREDEFHLPPLPDKGGIWSYFQTDNATFLERRAKYFHAIIVAAQNHAQARRSRLLNDFLGTPPDSVARDTSVENSYVSLNRFAAPKIRFSVEVQERREKALNISLKRSHRRCGSPHDHMGSDTYSPRTLRSPAPSSPLPTIVSAPPSQEPQSASAKVLRASDEAKAAPVVQGLNCVVNSPQGATSAETERPAGW
ncbi:TPA: hypothetical protein N0F65_002780 [Lagenidium giganteum]|uniref:PX domain-containing protein n=1 Tax=Lagenidium giganteum TaxID=4803 RepID=A0AAV2YNK6_9STRA|nr:TPA: hypothetical protein N0F65_002780 [Lagenidium giganteum]